MVFLDELQTVSVCAFQKGHPGSSYRFATKVRVGIKYQGLSVNMQVQPRRGQNAYPSDSGSCGIAARYTRYNDTNRWVLHKLKRLKTGAQHSSLCSANNKQHGSIPSCQKQPAPPSARDPSHKCVAWRETDMTHWHCLTFRKSSAKINNFSVARL